MYFLYSVLTAAGVILLSPYFLVQGLRRGKYLSSLRERLGYLPLGAVAPATQGTKAIWIHAVSVGETLAAVPLAQAFKKRFPSQRLVVSTTTATGQRVARERMNIADAVFYFPLDWGGPVHRVFSAVNPALVVVLETEIWPNFLREARRRGVPVVFANARISERSFRRYRWAKRLAPDFLSRVLSDGEIFLAQSADDARRLSELGAPEERLEVLGNLKYDLDPPELGRFGFWLAEQVHCQERWPLVVAGSVAAYDVVQRQWRRALLVLAPRKPERFDMAGQIATDDGWKVVRRSKMAFDSPLPEDVEVLLLDSIGELAGLYSLADSVFIGGSLVSAGGHNILEPAWFEKPPVFGPYMDNFRDMAAQFLSSRAAVQVKSGEHLGAVWTQLIGDPETSSKMGRTARALVEKNRGATARSIERIAAIFEGRRSGA
jgi:3-deoxy-D-manno-octulosonic-acid transferase